MALEHITVRETAIFLKVSEKTVYRWIRQGVIPAIKFQGQYRFDRKELEAWANYKRIGGALAPAALPEDNAHEEQALLLDAVRRGGIHYKIEGEGPGEIYRNLAELLPLGAGGEEDVRGTLVSELVAREELAPTGVGNGIALPHPRHPRDWGLGGPTVAIYFLERPVDFHAFDGEHVFVLFVVLCSTIKGHLRILSQVGHLLKESAVRDYIRSSPNRTELMEKIGSVVGISAK